MRNPLELNEVGICLNILLIIFEATFRGGFTIEGVYWRLSDDADKCTLAALPTQHHWL